MASPHHGGTSSHSHPSPSPHLPPSVVSNVSTPGTDGPTPILTESSCDRFLYRPCFEIGSVLFDRNYIPVELKSSEAEFIFSLEDDSNLNVWIHSKRYQSNPSESSSTSSIVGMESFNDVTHSVRLLRADGILTDDIDLVMGWRESNGEGRIMLHFSQPHHAQFVRQRLAIL